MASICDDRVILRDFQESDIAKRILWETEETEWQSWDAPWEYEQLTAEQKQKNLEKYIQTMQRWVEKYKAMPDTEVRTGFQICTLRNEYIGWCNAYRMDEDFTYAPDGQKCAVGIDIPDTSQRGKGCAFHALCLFIDYLLTHGEEELYTQTWSDNLRMLGLAEKLGFRECCRKSGIRTVRGKAYDGLTLLLDRDCYAEARKRL